MDIYPEDIKNYEILNFSKNKNVQELNIISLQYSGESGESVQDEITTTTNIVACNMLVDTTVNTDL